MKTVVTYGPPPKGSWDPSEVPGVHTAPCCPRRRFNVTVSLESQNGSCPFMSQSFFWSCVCACARACACACMLTRARVCRGWEMKVTVVSHRESASASPATTPRRCPPTVGGVSKHRGGPGSAVSTIRGHRVGKMDGNALKIHADPDSALENTDLN